MLGAPSKEDESRVDSGGNSGKGILILLAIVFFPAFILGWCYYGMLRFYKQRMSVITSTVFLVDFLAIIYALSTKAFAKAGEVFQDLGNISANWGNFIPFVIVVNVIIGGFFGLLLVFIQVRQMEANPHKLKLEGNWLYQFQYRRTPLQVLRRKKTIEGLRSGAFSSGERAPLGLDEKNDDMVAYRYNSEAIRQTLISGAAGSGKALSVDALIPTPDGFVRNNDLKIESEIFARDGSITKVVSFSPVKETPEYEVVFTDGTVVSGVSGDHLWTVTDNVAMDLAYSGKSGTFLNSSALNRLLVEVELSEEHDVVFLHDVKEMIHEFDDNEKLDFFVDSVAERILPSHEVEHAVIDGSTGAVVPADGSVEPIPLYPRLALFKALYKAASSYSDVYEAIRSLPQVVTTFEIMEGLNDGMTSYLVKGNDAVDYPERDVIVDPYLMGVSVRESDKDGVIPEEYLISSISQRLSLLHGLTDDELLGTDFKNYTFRHSSMVVILQFRELLSSLGIGSSLFNTGNDVLAVILENPFFGNSNSSIIPANVRNELSILTVRKTGRFMSMRCIAVDNSDHQFLVGRNYVPTHNTITMLSLMKNDIEHDIPVIGIDFKRSPELASKLAMWAKANNKNFYHFVNGDSAKYDVMDSPGQAVYDPLINGGASQADMLLGMREYDTASTVYKDSMRQLLQVLFSMLRYADKKKAPNIDWAHGTLYKVASAITGGNFTDLVGACEGTPIEQSAEEVEIGIRSKNSQLQRAMDELRGQMRTIVASEYGKWLRTSSNDRNINLYELTKSSDNVILFSLNSDSEKDFSKYIGSLILADLNAISAKRRNLGLDNQVNVYIDEFQAVSPTSVTSLLEKSRESKLGMTLASQSYEQIIAASDNNGEAYLIGILDTCSNFIVHNGATESSAKRLSEILGKRYETIYTTANQNEGFLFSVNFFNKRKQTVQTKEEERWIVHPREFMALSSPTKNNDNYATAMIINKASDEPLLNSGSKDGGAVARKVWMIPDNEVVGKYYIPTLAGDDEYAEKLDANADLSELVNPERSFVENNDVPRDYLSEHESSRGSSERVSRSNVANDFVFDDDDDTFAYDSAGSGVEEEDGDFAWEVEPDEDDDFGPDINVNKALSNRSVRAAEPEDEGIYFIEDDAPVVTSKRRSSKRSPLESSSFDSMFKDKEFKPEVRADAKSNSGGDRSRGRKVDDEDDALPDISEWF